MVVGSLNMDQLVSVAQLPATGATVAGRNWRQAPGGKGLNQAVAAARQGAPVTLIGAVGDDDNGAELLIRVAAEGIDASAVSVQPGAVTGLALITVADGGANTIVVVGGANAAVEAQVVSRALTVGPWSHRPLGAGDVLLTQLETPMRSVAAALRFGHQAGATTVLNPAPAAGPLPNALLALVDVVVPNETEAAALTGTKDPVAAARSLLAAGAAGAIVTLGAAGALVVTVEGTRSVPSYAVDAVDTTAAGDALCGCLAAALAAGATLDDAVRRGTAAGAAASTATGTLLSLPDSGTVDRLMAGLSI
ncbi:MAG: ribokinase [Actinomycetota bacterium]|nr:ribokinase [Actinomycetota bacterium]